jgi:hypothetical protein
MPIDSPASVSLWGDFPDWFDRAKSEYPHIVKFEPKDDNTIFEAYAWCKDRLGYPARMDDLQRPLIRPEGVWLTFGLKTHNPQIWFRDEKDASLFRVFFG